MGGASAPMLLCRIAAIGANSIGAEAPPTTAGSLKQQPDRSSLIAQARPLRPARWRRTSRSPRTPPRS
ncbi:DUF6053 domain-containing protein [Lysobacter enzymogenes]|uniref:DUF6053 domain-containing protein n=1 Tax=Lysobacter enzymogenes TaxID=69 RepID=UPI003D187E49